MKNSTNSAFGVPGCYSIAVVAFAASFAALPGWSEPSADEPRQGLAEITVSEAIPYVPVKEHEPPRLWTVRSRFDTLIESTARSHDVDPALVKAIVQAESAFDPEAVSRSGAQGLMQVLPTTASRFSINNLSDPGQNLKAGVLYLKHLLEIFEGDVTMAVAAYNAGPNTVRRHRGVPPYNETRTYLIKVMGLRDAYADQLRRS